GVILAVPMIAVVKVFLMFFRELYKGSHFYHAGKVNSAEAASEALEERLAIAAEIVLQEQTQAQTGTELLTPGERKDDPAAQV
ncbi:hypothetical protein, partial [Salmonella sp. SAL4449]|uniref:hypothetical protein n=1 Tax=Salmonella sp. SAL4449 TaxID=3159904 RepID=UPI00397DD3C9